MDAQQVEEATLNLRDRIGGAIYGATYEQAHAEPGVWDHLVKEQDAVVGRVLAAVADTDRGRRQRREADALRSAANDLPQWVPGRQRIVDWLWARGAAVEGSRHE